MQSQEGLQGTQAIVFMVIAFIGVTTIFGLLVLGIRSKLQAIRSQTLTQRADGGWNVPLAAAFSGLRGVPWIATTQSNIAPLLVLHEKDFEYRVVRLQRRPYSDIALVDIRTTIGTVNLVLEFNDSARDFSGNTASLENATKALALFEQKGCRLTVRAQALVRAMDAKEDPRQKSLM